MTLKLYLAQSGEEALQLLMDIDFGLAILDVQNAWDERLWTGSPHAFFE